MNKNALNILIGCALLFSLLLLYAMRGPELLKTNKAGEMVANLPRSMVALVAIGAEMREKKFERVILGDGFWSAMKLRSEVVALSPSSNRNDAYIAIMEIISLYSPEDKNVNTENVTTMLAAVLDWGLLSDYLVVSGGLTRIENKFGRAIFSDSNWIPIFLRLNDVAPFIRNEIIQNNMSKENRERLERVCVNLFSGISLDVFNQDLKKINEFMHEQLISGDRELALLYFKIPDLSRIAIPVYRNRTIWAESIKMNPRANQSTVRTSVPNKEKTH